VFGFRLGFLQITASKLITEHTQFDLGEEGIVAIDEGGKCDVALLLKLSCGGLEPVGLGVSSYIKYPWT
jgi:hypothetical protein